MRKLNLIVVFNKDKESLLSPRGSIVTTFASQGDLDNYANNLYDLIRDAFEVYSIKNVKDTIKIIKNEEP